MVSFYNKNGNIDKIYGILVLKAIFSETTCVCVLTCQFYAPTAKRTPKKLTQIRVPVAILLDHILIYASKIPHQK